MRRIALASAVLLLLGSSAQAQDTFSLDFRGGPSFATADLAEASLKTGASLGVTASYRVFNHMRIYGGWDWTHFVTDEPFEGNEFDVEPNGYAFGMQFQHPMAGSIAGWLRAGGLYNHIELESEAGDIIDSGHELGWEAGAGIRVPISSRLAFTPGVRYRAFSADLNVDGEKIPVDMKFVSAEIGLSLSFGSSSVAALIK